MLSQLYNKLKVAFFLSFRQVKRANLWVNILIIFIMVITFLNLVFISGILEGLVAGASQDSKNHYSGDIIITPKEDRITITGTNRLLDQITSLKEISFYSPRYISGAKIETDYSFFLSPNIEDNIINATLVGVNFEKENRVTDLEKFIVSGEYPRGKFQNKAIVGSGLLDQYESAIEGNTLKGVNVGDKISISFSENKKEYIVSGIVQSKLNQINNRVFIDSKQFIMLTGRSFQNSDEIAMLVNNNQDIEKIKEKIETFSFMHDAKVETWQESQGQFFEDLSTTFTILGAVIGAIGLAVASVTLFIVIFINAISREKYIGILKGIGIDSSIIKYSYVFQSIFYAFIGSLIGVLILYIVLVPYFDQNPIDFPFSDGILDVTYEGVFLRVLILFISSIIAGFIPSHLIVKKNTIDSILGR